MNHGTNVLQSTSGRISLLFSTLSSLIHPLWLLLLSAAPSAVSLS